MKKPYKLLRDLPWAKAGSEWTIEAQTKCLDGHYIMKEKDVEGLYNFPYSTFTEWFEEKDGRWKPKDRESYFFPSVTGEVNEYTVNSTFDREVIAFGGALRTRELAEGFLSYLKEALDKYHELISE